MFEMGRLLDDSIYSILLQATVSVTIIPIGKILIGAGRPGFWVISVAHDSFSIAMISMVKVVPGMI